MAFKPTTNRTSTLFSGSLKGGQTVSRQTKQNGAQNGSASDVNAETIRRMQTSLTANKICFDCRQQGPTYVNLTIGTFVCTKCSGQLRGLNPPHRIKSISMSAFSDEDVTSMRSRGNAWAQLIWLGLYNAIENKDDVYSFGDKAMFKPVSQGGQMNDDQISTHLIDKYERKRYYIHPANVDATSLAAATISAQLNGDPDGSNPLRSTSGSVSCQRRDRPKSSVLIGTALNARIQQQHNNVRNERHSPTLSTTSSASASLRSAEVVLNCDLFANDFATANGNTNNTENNSNNMFVADFDSASLASSSRNVENNNPAIVVGQASSVGGRKSTSSYLDELSDILSTASVSHNSQPQSESQLSNNSNRQQQAEPFADFGVFDNFSTKPIMSSQQSKPSIGVSTDVVGFANFDAAKFDDTAGLGCATFPSQWASDPPLATPQPALMSNSQAKFDSTYTPVATNSDAKEDRYAALKDLDDMLKMNAVANTSANLQSQHPTDVFSCLAPQDKSNLLDTNDAVNFSPWPFSADERDQKLDSGQSYVEVAHREGNQLVERAIVAAKKNNPFLSPPPISVESQSNQDSFFGTGSDWATFDVNNQDFNQAKSNNPFR